MTSRKGSLWKSSWNRGRGTPIPDVVGNMAFFRDFADGGDAAFYTTGPDSTLGASLPFWFGVVGIRPFSGDQKFNAPDGLVNIIPASDTDVININGTVGGTEAVTMDVSLAVTGDDFVCAALVRVTKDPDGDAFTVRVRLGDQVEQVFHGVGYTAPTFPLTISPNSLPGAFHGVCGGPGELTATEIRTWFAQLKADLAIPAIAGKTTHRYSAAAVYPTVPTPMANLGTDATQDVTLDITGAPTPANVLIPVRFPY